VRRARGVSISFINGVDSSEVEGMSEEKKENEYTIPDYSPKIEIIKSDSFITLTTDPSTGGRKLEYIEYDPSDEKTALVFSRPTWKNKIKGFLSFIDDYYKKKG